MGDLSFCSNFINLLWKTYSVLFSCELMNKYIVCLITVFSSILFCPFLYGQKINYQQFNNIYLGPETSVVCCFLQDSEGLIWIGSNKGLFSYDGYSTQPHFTYGDPSNTRINCGVLVDSTYLYLGADNGMLMYNYKTDRYETPAVHFPTDIRTLALQGDTLWIGTLNGLYTYQFKSKQLHAVDAKKSHLPHSTIYSVIRTRDQQIYVGTYNGLCRYDEKTRTFQTISLPSYKGKNNVFINSLLEDPRRSCIWIGTEGSLFQYLPQENVTRQIEVFHDNSIKSLALDGNESLLVGTDNGLYVYTDDSTNPQHIVHDSRNIQSLTNNIIWNIFTDAEHNVWLGTDYGISLSRYNSAFQYVPISQITQTGDGNQFYSMLRDSRGLYWFGGTNGLIRFSDPVGYNGETCWYQMGSKSYPLTHNRIRHIYEDKDHQLWVATDGSIHRYDYDRRQFVHYNIVDNTGNYNSNWAYYLFEDNEGRLWISTCLGGIFVVDKKKLLASGSASYVAEQNYSIHNGLSGMFINQIVPDSDGNVWVLLYNNQGIDKINPRTRQVTKMFVKELSGDHTPNYLLTDQQGYLWVGFRGGVMRVNPKDGSFRTVSFGAFGNDEILAMMYAEGCIWVSTTNGLWTIEAQSMDARQLNMTDKRFTSLFFDASDRHIYLGGADGFAISQPEVLRLHQNDHPILLTAIYINNQQMMNHPDESEPTIRYARRIDLNYKQNNLAFDVSDLPYSLEEKNKFVYRLEGMDKEWNYLKPNSNRITYSNLHYGSYQLVIKKLDSNGVPSDSKTYTLDVLIAPPWYYTIAAKTLYFILIISLIAWTVNFFRVKNRLKQERKEKEQILEQSRSKIDFFNHLSNELKTPLSHIIAPVSKLLPGMKETDDKQTLEEVQQNALKINSLLHQMLDFSAIEQPKDSLLILSRIEVVSFARSQFMLYKENTGEKSLTFHFDTNIGHVYTDMDAIKLGVILNNLLSNAVKFTPNGGAVSFSLHYEKGTGRLDISISDTGVGIPQQDIPYIFQRFFQSPHTGLKREGTGMGLYLVKTYTELHGGYVNSVTSQEGQGTTVKLTIPVVAIEKMSTAEETSNAEETSTTEKTALTDKKTTKAKENLLLEKESISEKAGTIPEKEKETILEKEKETTLEKIIVAHIPLQPIEVESQDEKFLNKIVRIIEDHISDSDLNVNALCEWSGISNKQIYRKLKQMTGMTPVEYIKSIRMKKAAMLLQQKKFTVAEVMYMVGFSNHSYFSKCFQTEFGKTPKEYIHQ